MNRFSDLSAALAFLEARSIMPSTAPSLEPMRKALARSPWFRAPDPKRNIIIAGTNGKGSTAATLSALLQSTGERVGLYTSPHLVNICERFRITESDIDSGLFLEALHANLETIEALKLTHFEALTLMAAWIFHSGVATPPCDWAIWEVGLGGLWDATNAIPHHFCAITRLGFDHEGLLGNTLEEIATQKFGVIPPKGVVVYSPMEKSLAPLRERYARDLNCQWIPAAACEEREDLSIHTPWGETRMALEGARAVENSATALTLLESLGFAPAKHLKALRQVRWPGRFQQTEWRGRRVYLSGDHNPQGVESLLAILRKKTYRKLHILLGICSDKSAALMGDLLLALPRAELHLTQTPFKTLPLSAYPESLRLRAQSMEASPSLLLDRVTAAASDDDLVLVTGSLYLVGEILSRRPG
jgi:dihydrofolate synthase / folylpolyglutamate synthase